jgi:hypothetical protein
LRRLCSFRDLPGRLGQVPGGRPLGRHGWRLGLWLVPCRLSVPDLSIWLHARPGAGSRCQPYGPVSAASSVCWRPELVLRQCDWWD